MVQREDMYLKDLSGTLMYRDIPLFSFEIKEGNLINYSIKKEDKQFFPMEFAMWDIDYYSINSFFKERVVLDGSQDIRGYLNALDMNRYDFERIVKYHSGRNYLDEYWLDMTQTE